MKNGYYISAYCCIDEEGCCLNAQIRHDQTIALWKVDASNVTLVRYWELERYTRKKQHLQPFISNLHFGEVLDDLLCEVDLNREDILEIWGMPNFIQNNNDVIFAKQFNIPLHSIFHVFSALIDTEKLFKEKHLILALDGGPDNVIDKGFDLSRHYCAVLFDRGKIISVEDISSPAYLWAEASDKFMMREGTLMALAEACNCKCDDVSIHISSFKGMWEVPQLRSELEKAWSTIQNRQLDYDKRFTIEENRISCFMKLIQKVSREMVEEQIIRIIRKFDVNPSNTILSLVGGFALNCPTNTWIMNRFKFKEFVAPPCVNDSGIALGIGLLKFYLYYGSSFKFELKSAFWGHEESIVSYENFKTNYKHYIKDITEFNILQFVTDLENEPVCWFEGKSEIGPRALGHRSILSSASSVTMKDKLNKIKQREWWRPVAPIVLDHVANDWFNDYIASPYMLHAIKIKSDKAHLVPAVLHLNDTARIQTISSNDFFYDILSWYYKITGIPMICNTSLNDKGEPIINTYEELVNFALRKNIKIIYIERKRIELYNHKEFTKVLPHKSENVFDSYLKTQNDVFAKYANVVIDDEDLDFYVNHRELFATSIFWLTQNEQKELVNFNMKKIYENLSS